MTIKWFESLRHAHISMHAFACVSYSQYLYPTSLIQKKKKNRLYPTSLSVAFCTCLAFTSISILPFVGKTSYPSCPFFISDISFVSDKKGVAFSFFQVEYVTLF